MSRRSIQNCLSCKQEAVSDSGLDFSSALHKSRVAPLPPQLSRRFRNSLSKLPLSVLIPVVVPETETAFPASRRQSLFRDWTYAIKKTP